MTTLMYDTFGGSGTVLAHTSDSGHTWAADLSDLIYPISPAGAQNDMIVSGSGATMNTSVGSPTAMMRSSLVLPSADYYVLAAFKPTAPGGQTSLILNLRDNGLGDSYQLTTFYWDATHVHLNIYRESGGPIYGTTFAVADPTNYTVRVEVQGSALRVFLNGTQIITASDASLSSAGSVVFGLNWPSGASAAYLSRIEVGPLPYNSFWTDFVQTTET